MRYDEMQRLAGALLALLDGSASARSAGFGQLPTRRRETQRLLRHGIAAQEPQGTDTLTVTDAESPAAMPSQLSVGEAATDSALRTSAPTDEMSALSLRSADVRVFTACYGEALEELDRRFRRDSRRYDSGFDTEE